MNIIEAFSIAKHEPSTVARSMKSFIFGCNKGRDVSYFDLFLFYPLYTYKPAESFFNKQMSLTVKHKSNFFIKNTNESPEIFANIKIDYYSTIELVKEAIIYGVNREFFYIDNNLDVHLVKKSVDDKNQIAENIGKLYSTQSTAYWFKYLKVNIDAI
jgi:hypothetical protein